MSVYPALSCAAAFAATARELVLRLDWGRYLDSARQHGLGMLQGELTEELRVHLWHPGLRTLEMSQDYRNVHDHRFDLLSCVVAAAEASPLVDVSYDIGELIATGTVTWTSDTTSRLERVKCPPGHVACSAIRHAKIQSGSDAADSTLLGYCKPRRTEARFYGAGDVYHVLRRSFHTTEVTGPVVTVVHRSNFDTRSARVLGPVDKQTTSAIVKDPDRMRWTECLEEALAILHRGAPRV